MQTPIQTCATEPADPATLAAGPAGRAETVMSVTFPGLAAVVPSARRLVRVLLAGCPRVGDLELMASELISNSLRHTPAGDPGGMFTLAVRFGAGRARVEVSGPSSPWPPDREVGCLDEDGRGLVIIAALADGFGHRGDAVSQAAWAEVDWPEGGAHWSLSGVAS